VVATVQSKETVTDWKQSDSSPSSFNLGGGTVECIERHKTRGWKLRSYICCCSSRGSCGKEGKDALFGEGD
jgi:hypothetical protein